MTVLAFELPAQALATGAMTGLTYAVLAAGLVLVFRATRIVNFAHGDAGAFAALVLGKLVADHDWPYLAGLVCALLAGGALGAVMELVVVRRLFAAPRLVLLVATIGLSQLIFALTLLVFDIDNATNYPVPFERTVSLGPIDLLGPELLAIVAIPPLILFVGLFLGRTPYGIAIRASAENADAALLAGISVKRVSTVVWVLAGVLAAATVVVYNPLRNPSLGLPTAAFGPSLVLRALAAGLIGRMQNLPLALVGGLGLGIAEAVLLVNFGDPGLVNLVFAVLVVGLVLLRARSTVDDAESIVPPAVRRAATTWPAVARRVRQTGIAASAAVAVLLPFVFDSSSQISLFARVVLFAVVGLSVTLVTGWAGQLSLGQFAFVGVGAVGTLALVNRGMPFGAALGYATVAGVGLGLLVAWPALRVGGLFLAVTTLGFAIAVDSWLLRRPELVGEQATVASLPRGQVGPIDFTSQRTYYYLCLAVLAAAMAAVSHLRRTGVGRSLIAVRENERSAAAFTVSPARAKLTAFGVSAGLAALAGGLLAGLIVQVRVDAFSPSLSLQVVAMTIIGGLGSVAGAALGAAWMLGLPALLGDSAEVRALTSGAGLLVLLLYLPGGLLSLVHRAGDAIVAAIATRRPGPPTPAAPPARARSEIWEEPRTRVDRNPVALRLDHVTVRYGGRIAVDGVSLEARTGSVVGLIGSNGAGKTTLMNAICGFVPASGTVHVNGIDVTSAAPHRRAQAGLGRAFQNAKLFGDLTVRETVLVALESTEASELVPSLLSLPPSRRAERLKSQRADELIHLVGMDRYADVPIATLSTGTRRIAELACLMALESPVLLLDEPTAGVAQRETEAFGPLILRIRAELDATVVIIEHDMPLIMAMSDTVHCLEAGRLIASGTPEQVRNDPRVIASYLGTDERAIERSGAKEVVAP